MTETIRILMSILAGSLVFAIYLTIGLGLLERIRIELEGWEKLKGR